ncbi:hypothetical protein B0H63DRAFT_477061 [Podospora didyma]|uniref:Uncharacterized protein n=1 Tax=Podospora didyma TaxID=330526 RepID=A0AAE0NIC4_9PEZI|nr:hypothetical protein B0H63DRAFT_477061 [Podospora didyma]
MRAMPDESVAVPSTYVRLHITPLDADLLPVVLSTALLPKARNISYHALDTIPEKRYGFLDLPDEDAEKLKKKLNGSVVKGVKIRIERARPSHIPVPLGEAAMARDKASKTFDTGNIEKAKKRKRDPKELTGIMLEEGRTVKRGWTDPDQAPKERKDKREKKEKKEKKAKTQDRSKYTDHPECLVKTILPPNAPVAADALEAVPKKRKKGKSRETVVHEFEKTAKFPSFLKMTDSSGPSKPPLEYVDGKGWVDENGTVVEAVKTRPPKAAKIKAAKKAEPKQAEVDPTDAGRTSSDRDGMGAISEVESPAEAGAAPPTPSRAEESDAGQADEQTLLSSSLPKADPSRPKSSSSVKSLTIIIPPATPKEAKVHPLEALYKRPKQPDGAVSEGPHEAKGFSFFDAANGEHSGEENTAPIVQVPMTPYTRHDIESRGVRSAAPTPDTAHPNQRFKPWAHEDDEIVEDEDEDEDVDDHDDVEMNVSATTPAQTTGPEAEGASSDFQKWFWENRGDLNRSWKKRRKMAGKEKRYRENKARVARAI